MDWDSAVFQMAVVAACKGNLESVICRGWEGWTWKDFMICRGTQLYVGVLIVTARVHTHFFTKLLSPVSKTPNLRYVFR